MAARRARAARQYRAILITVGGVSRTRTNGLFDPSAVVLPAIFPQIRRLWGHRPSVGRSLTSAEVYGMVGRLATELKG
jgi:hypothetical protein